MPDRTLLARDIPGYIDQLEKQIAELEAKLIVQEVWEDSAFEDLPTMSIGARLIHQAINELDRDRNMYAERYSEEADIASNLVSENNGLRYLIKEVAIPSLKYCEEKYGYDDQARLNLEAGLAGH